MDAKGSERKREVAASAQASLGQHKDKDKDKDKDAPSRAASGSNAAADSAALARARANSTRRTALQRASSRANGTGVASWARTRSARPVESPQATRTPSEEPRARGWAPESAPALEESSESEQQEAS
eukprot:2293424-Rhodomonas_salina.1